MEKILVKINDIIKHNINLLPYYNLTDILKLDIISLSILLNAISDHININNIKSYKKISYEPLIIFISKIIINANNKLNMNNLLNKNTIFISISLVNNAHLILKSLNNIIKFTNSEIILILENISESTTFLTFMYWWNKIKTNEQTIISSLLKKAIKNSDDRILKLLLSIINNKINDISNELVEILLTSTLIPRKSLLHKLRLVTNTFENPDYFKIIIKNVNSIDLICILSKYYYNTELDFEILSTIMQQKILKYNEAFNIYLMLKTIQEKNTFVILCNIHGYYHDNFIIINNIDWDVIKKNYKYIILHLYNQLNCLYKVENNNYISLNEKIFKYLIENKLIEPFLKSSINVSIYYNLLKYTRFFYNGHIYQIKINKVLHLLRCLLKRKINKSKINFKLNFTPIIKELKEYEPSNKFVTLHNGSYNYQLTKQKFNRVPPRHILPMEDICNKKFLIKEKADGVLVITTPTNIFPPISEILEFEIKAEYIEELNIYLIFDINIPNLTIYERYELLRSLHYSTKYINPNTKINNFHMLMDEIAKERFVFNKFINTLDKRCCNKILWYPKCCWEVLIDHNFYFEICNFISETSQYTKFILYGEYKNDGLILTPLDGSRELKIKPKVYQTIDLLYKNDMWYDADNNVWKLSTIPNKKYKNKVYRCYPIENNKYTPAEIRYDKEKPNSYFIINQIQNINKFDWLSNNINLLDNIKYYENTKIIKDNHLIKILNNQTNNLKNIIESINPQTNKKWLDLGCGKCKVFKIIKDIYYPHKYTGIDNDISLLSQVYNLVDENNKIVNLHPCNLKYNWNDQINLWSSFNWSIKYNYIIANFSISYFWSELFWEQLNNITEKGSIFIFNIVDKNKKWEWNDSYLESNNDKTKIYFNWVHDHEHEEPIIKPEFYINKYGWNIINKYNFEGNLTSCYSWYVLVKED